MITARSIRVQGIVQGVGFRPFVFRIARANGLNGWVANTQEGVKIFVEGSEPDLDKFLSELKTEYPPAACISSVEVQPAELTGLRDFAIVQSRRDGHVSARVSPDLAICDDCLRELFDPHDRRCGYPYINCTNCGPRYSIVRSLPYDRPNTTMAAWRLDERCAHEYGDPANRRFHTQPVACPECGPSYFLRQGDQVTSGNDTSIRRAAELLKWGEIVAIKGLGGYHLACDAQNAGAVRSLRERKFRKEKPFALMAKNLQAARDVIDIDPELESLLTSVTRPIVLAPLKTSLAGIAPDTHEFGVMLPYTPLHHLLFAAGAPDILVMTSANRSSEPIAYEDEDALRLLSGIADALLVGERPIARRVDDSVVRHGAFGPTVLRRARGLAPSAVATVPCQRPILAVGADLKNSVTLVVDGQAFVSQHIGDLDYSECRVSFRHTIEDLLSMYALRIEDVLVVHDAHPQYVSTCRARELSSDSVAIQHHRAHVASVLAERNCPDTRVIGVSFDGTGYGDDGTIWGGEIFAGSLESGLRRVAHLRQFDLPGGDAAARFPVQAAAGFVAQLPELPDLMAPPFNFPRAYILSVEMLAKGIRTFASTSAGRLFDAAAALLGFTREISFEGQAAAWIENKARGADRAEPYPFPFIPREVGELDFRPLLENLIPDRIAGRALEEIARSFQLGFARGLCEAILSLCQSECADIVVLSGGVFQNDMLLRDVKSVLASQPIHIWTNHAVPPNDGGISLGQAALAAFQQLGESECRAQRETRERAAAVRNV